ncbi:MAG: phosphonate transport system permease protein [Candidatus Paceibacteria bacterium]|jgi:phosphonate transport system permease protein
MPARAATPVPFDRPRLLGTRRAWLVGILLAGLWAALGLGVAPSDLVPTGSGQTLFKDFFAAALSPALTYEEAVPEGTLPLVWKILDSMRRTLIFAATGLSLALLIGLPLGLLASTVWWHRPQRGGHSRRGALSRLVPFGLFLGLRTGIAALRSVHELLWAVLLLAAMGLNSFSAVCAIALPFAGTLAKVFSEILDETPRDTADVLRAGGASEWQIFVFGFLPRALPDMAAYTFYRFECAVRSSAVLGFFGFPTLGYYIKIAFDNQHYHEVWAYLWALIALVFVLEATSGALRRRVVAR